MNVPLIKPDLPYYDELENSFREILANGRITNFGKYVTQFEQEASQYLDAQVATVSSGTMGLLFALQTLGLQKGQKVILPSFTFMATAQAVLYAGGIPIFAEVSDDLTLAVDDLEMLLAQHPDTTIVMGTHAYGLPCQTQEIQTIVDKATQQHEHPIAILYDAAHAFGSAKDGRRVGTFGDVEVFSLSVTKALVCVEGGLIASRNESLIQRIRKMRNYGIEENYNAFYAGLNGKMSEFHAIVGLHNLQRLDEILAERQHKASYYMQQIEAQTNLGILSLPNHVRHTFKDFTVMLPEPFACHRKQMMALLKERGIETRAYFYPPVHQQKFFQAYVDRPLPRTEALAERVLTLPFYTSITQAEMDYVVQQLVAVERRLA